MHRSGDTTRINRNGSSVSHVARTARTRGSLEDGTSVVDLHGGVGAVAMEADHVVQTVIHLRRV